MAVPTHFRFVIRGSFTGTPEGWSTSCHFTRAVSGFPDAGLDDINEAAVTTACNNFWGSSLIQSQVQVDDWRFYAIGTDGHMQGNGPLLHTYAPGTLKGTGQPWSYPPQVSLVVSSIAVNRGPAKRGRMFFPGPNKSMASDGRLSIADAGAFVTGTVAWLKALSDCIDLAGTVSSEMVNISPGPPGSATGTKQNVDHFEIGRVFDTMRSRRSSMVEDPVVTGHIDW